MEVTPHLNQRSAIIQKGKQLRKNESWFNVPEPVLKIQMYCMHMKFLIKMSLASLSL